MRRTLTILLFFLTSFSFSLVLHAAMHRRPNRVIAEWKQPDTIKYDSRGPYYLRVKEGNVDWSFFLLGWERHYEIFVGREGGVYGHSIEFSFDPDYEDLESYLKRSNVEWSEAGVTFNEPSGHVLFIPKQMYIGGR